MYWRSHDQPLSTVITVSHIFVKDFSGIPAFLGTFLGFFNISKARFPIGKLSLTRYVTSSCQSLQGLLYPFFLKQHLHLQEMSPLHRNRTSPSALFRMALHTAMHRLSDHNTTRWSLADRLL